jgi:hypothetical protein
VEDGLARVNLCGMFINNGLDFAIGGTRVWAVSRSLFGPLWAKETRLLEIAADFGVARAICDTGSALDNGNK